MAVWPALVFAAALPSAANAQDLGVGLNRSISFVIFAISDDGSTIVPNVAITGIAELQNARTAATGRPTIRNAIGNSWARCRRHPATPGRTRTDAS